MFVVGNPYSKRDIYTILNVPTSARKGAWDTGYRKYKNAIYVFANIGVSGRTGQNHNNYWENRDLVWFSKARTTVEQPQLRKILDPINTVHIFTREDSRAPFTYQGIGKVKRYTNTSPVKIVWRFDNPELIDTKTVWSSFLTEAKAYLKSGEIYRSPRKGVEYRITKASTAQIVITSPGSKSRAKIVLSGDIFKAAITKWNAAGGSLPIGKLHKEKAIETTLVEFLPMLDYDDAVKHIIQIRASTPETTQSRFPRRIKEAANDEDKKTIGRQLKARRGQNKLRKNLFLLYQGKCCISGTAIKDTLHACHIIPHSRTGNNSSFNALLLRSDIHDLFDAHLIGIDPQSLRIVIKKPLYKTEYFRFNGIMIAGRIDRKRPDLFALKERWAHFNN